MGSNDLRKVVATTFKRSYLKLNAKNTNEYICKQCDRYAERRFLV